MWLKSVLASGILAVLATSTFAADDKAGLQFFEKHIRPVLVSKCYSCHSAAAKKSKGGLALDTREGIRSGGESGKAVVPGNIEDSILMEALRHDGLEMPPDEKLADDTIAKFEQWIRMGAPDPRDGKSSGKKEIDFGEARQFWAFQPISQPKIPTTKNKQWPKSDIDRFVLAKLEAAGLSPAQDADVATLCRRMYFDLIGLPPTPEQQQVFATAMAKNRDAAIATLIDELLATPQFGERWGRHWLDVVRFAESTGMERNFTFPHAWKYRDYVIRSLNSDKPFDQFVREQVAGDLLPFSSPEQRREQVVATGFLAIGPKSLNERDKEQFAMDIVDDQIDSTFRSFAGLTAGCARCHDHKFDPIPQKEYYGLAGIFRSTETLYGTGGQQGNRQPGKLLAFADGEMKSVRPASVDDAKNKAGKPAPAESVSELQQQLKVAEERLERIQKRADAPAPKKKDAKADKLLKETIAQVAKLKARLKATKEEVAPTQENVPAKLDDFLMAVVEGTKPSDTQVRVRGEPNDKGDTIPRGFLTMGNVGQVAAIPAEHSGRLELASWLTQPDNTLTMRVAANRVWHHLFGRGIVASVDNFGTQGDRPSHPELLDWLAHEFRAKNGSTKDLIRLIMRSRVYQLAAVENAKAHQVDPEIALLWRARHRRLEVEAIRDAILVASGRLDREVSGVGSLVASIGDGDIGRGVPASRFAAVSNKRSVYLPIVRTLLPEMLQLFDYPEPSNINGQREVTTVPTQALYLMNSQFSLDEAEHFAKRLIETKDVDDPARIKLAYRIALSRDPYAIETTDAVKFTTESTLSFTSSPKDSDAARLKAWTALCQALFESAEFRYVE